MIIDILDPRANRDEQLFCHYVFKFLRIKLSKSPEDVDLLAAPECELGLKEGFDHMSLVLQLGADGRYHLASVDPGHCAQGFPKTLHIFVWSLSAPAQNNILQMRVTWKGWSHTLMKPTTLGRENQLCHRFLPCTCWYR